jgi:pimeloyl-ACP methyl ester carboxylesterase
MKTLSAIYKTENSQLPINSNSLTMASTDLTSLTIPTTHALLSVTTIGTGSPALLLLHGNSFCSKIFKHILASPLSKTYKIITFDLPGHGESANAMDPARSYNQPGYAAAAVELLNHLGVKEAIILGWSLGGHIGIEMLPLFPGIKGLMIVGTPPVGHSEGELNKAFTFGSEGWENVFAARDDLTDEEITEFAHGCTDAPYEEWMRDCVKRTDQKARKMMFVHFDEGKCADQRKLVGETKVPIAVVNGAKEPFINLAFVKSVEFGNLWGGECIEMVGLLHAPFWAKPDEFQPILEAFVEDVST